MNTNIIEVVWPITGHSIPRDHGYLLWTALAERVPALCQEPGWAVGPVRGAELGDRLMLGEASTLRIRLPATEFGQALALSGATLRIGLDHVSLGKPRTSPLASAKSLRAHVAIASCLGDAVDAVVRRDLGLLLEQDPWTISVRIGPQRVLRARDRTVMVYEVTLSGLEPLASVELQARGLGTRRHMGAGFFEPI